MAEQIEVQGNNVIITKQVTVSKSEYLASQQARLDELQASLQISQNQMNSIISAISEIQNVIESLS